MLPRSAPSPPLHLPPRGRTVPPISFLGHRTPRPRYINQSARVGRAGAAGYLVAGGVSMHEGSFRRDRLLSPLPLCGYSHLLRQLGRDLGRRGSGLDGHHPGLAAFLANTHSPALEFWRRQERHHLWPLPEHTHNALKWAAPRCSPCPRVPEAPFCSRDLRLLLLGLHGAELVASNHPAALLVVFSFRSPTFAHRETTRFLHESSRPQISVYHFVKVVHVY